MFFVIHHARRSVLHVRVTEHPTAGWITQQLLEAFPYDAVPRYLIFDNPYVERVIGSIRRECLDHVVVLDEGHLRRILRSYFAYLHLSRTHLSLDKDSTEPREVEPLHRGEIVAIPEVGGLHHRYMRRAA